MLLPIAGRPYLNPICRKCGHPFEEHPPVQVAHAMWDRKCDHGHGFEGKYGIFGCFCKGFMR